MNNPKTNPNQQKNNNNKIPNKSNKINKIKIYLVHKIIKINND